jgi:hypothetical protein
VERFNGRDGCAERDIARDLGQRRGARRVAIVGGRAAL